jgi:hypothetical protein
MSDDLKDELKENGLENGPDHLTAKVGLEPAVAGKGVQLLPGVVAIALYMLVLAAVITFGVVGKHVPWIFLIIAPFFVTASFGLLRMFRWAWALTLSAVFLLMSYNFWIFATQRQPPGAIQGLLNLVFFFYLVRVDVRSRLR